MEKWLIDFFERQVSNWDLAYKNFKALKTIERKPFFIGDLKGYIQFNPARAVSTLATVDAKEISKRPCFLCEEHRPECQDSIILNEKWELLVNPFPILPFHFTIAGLKHSPQKLIVEEGIELASKLTGIVVFFNDEGAGASAPDHIHFQAVPLSELPLIRLIEDEDSKLSNLPYKLLTDIDTIRKNRDPLNVFFWKSAKDNQIKLLAVPRKAHRPKEFFLEPPKRRAVSPGAIDMAGIIITPIKQDFDLISQSDIENIYRQVAFSDEN